MNYLTNAGGLLLNVLFGALVALFVLRLLAEANRADFNNPICQFLYRLTNPVLRPLRKALPSVRRVNLGALLIALVIECVKVVFIVLLAGLPIGPLGALVLFSCLTAVVAFVGYELIHRLGTALTVISSALFAVAAYLLWARHPNGLASVSASVA